MKTTISKELPPIPGLEGAIINCDVSLDFPNNINISYTTIQKDKQRTDVGEEFFFAGTPVPLTKTSVNNVLNMAKDIIYSTIQIGMKEFNTDDPEERKEYEKLEKKLKKFSIEQTKTVSSLAESIILSVEYKYNVPRPEYVLEPTLLTFGVNNDDQRNIPEDNVTLVNDPETAALAPQQGVISDFGMNYDMSGPTKTREFSAYSQGVIQSQRVETWGYAYSTFDNSVVTALGYGRPYYGASLQMFWRPVETYTITYNYKNNLYTGYTKTGTKYARFAQEQDLEYYETEDRDIQRLVQYFSLGLFEKESLFFENLADSYPDLDNMPRCISEEFYNKETGKLDTKIVPNPDYKPSLYVKEKRMFSRCFAKRSVPEDAPIANGLENQMISTGQENKLIENTDIISATDSPSTSSYRVYRYQESSQDADFKNNLKISGSEMFLGRPPQVSFINTKEQDPAKKSEYVVVAGVDIYDKENYKSAYYPEAKSISEAFDLFKRDEDYKFISEMRGDEITITLSGFYEAYPGNIVSADTYEGILKSISYQIEVVKNGVYKIYTKLVLVKLPDYLPSDLLELVNVTEIINDECVDVGVPTNDIMKEFKDLYLGAGRN